MKRKKRYSITLIEIMIVIMLIGLVTGALAFNMSGSMDKGRAFKTEQNIARIYDILFLHHASSDEDLESIRARWETIVQNSPMVLNQGKDLLVDGWKQPFNVTLDKGELKVSSPKLEEYKTKYDQTKKNA